jgi:hypothetical protein
VESIPRSHEEEEVKKKKKKKVEEELEIDPYLNHPPSCNPPFCELQTPNKDCCNKAFQLVVAKAILNS